MREAHRQALICAAYISKRKMVDKIKIRLRGLPYPMATATISVTLHGVTVRGTIQNALKGDGKNLAQSLLKDLDKVFNT